MLTLITLVYTEYEIVVNTGTKPRSGTTANVFLTMYGKNGASPKLKLVNKRDEDVFSKGKKDTFHHVIDDLGPIVRCRYVVAINLQEKRCCE